MTTSLTTNQGVRVDQTDDSLPQDFVGSFCTAVGQHRAWERPAAAVPA